MKQHMAGSHSRTSGVETGQGWKHGASHIPVSVRTVFELRLVPASELFDHVLLRKQWTGCYAQPALHCAESPPVSLGCPGHLALPS